MGSFRKPIAACLCGIAILGCASVARAEIEFPDAIVGEWHDAKGRKYYFDYGKHTKSELHMQFVIASHLVTFKGKFRRITKSKPGRLFASPETTKLLKKNMPQEVLDYLVKRKARFEIRLVPVFEKVIRLKYSEHPMIDALRRKLTQTAEQVSEDEIRVEFWTQKVKYDENNRIIGLTPVRFKTETIQRSQRVCGPKVAEKVQDAMDHLYESAKLRSKEALQRLCGQLVDPRTGANAWDIAQFGPGPTGATRFARHCARPRDPCAKTVQFGGFCVNYQELNYVEWGVMSAICEKVMPNFALRAKAVHRLWTSNEAIRARQTIFANLGRYLVDARERNKGTRVLFIFSAFDQYVKSIVSKDPDLMKYWPNKGAQSCKMVCKIDGDDKKKWDRLNLIWHWGEVFAGKK